MAAVIAEPTIWTQMGMLGRLLGHVQLAAATKYDPTANLGWKSSAATCAHYTPPAVNVPLAPRTPGKTLMYMLAQLI